MSIFKFRARIPKTFQSWQVKDEYQSETTHNRWTNIDLIPTPESERNFTGKSFFAFWIAAAVNISAWTTGSANLANGLSAGETIAYWGGLAMKVLLSCIFPSFQYMANTLPQSAAITTNQLIGFIIYIIVFTPMMLIHPSKLHKFLWVAFGCVLCTILGLFIWAVASNGGASLNTIQKVKISKATRSFRMLQAVSSVAGAWCGSAIRQSDWTRYAKTKRAAAINQLITLPLVLTVTAALGTFATSAVTNMYGKQIWQPITLLEFLLMDNYNAATRAGCFFAAFGFFLSQVSVNLVQNSVAAGMDLASLAPKWIDVKRAGFIIATGGATLENPAWLRLFQTAWFVGFLGSSVVYFVISIISPPPGHPYESELFGNEQDGMSVIDGQIPSGSDMPNRPGKEGRSPDLKAVRDSVEASMCARDDVLWKYFNHVQSLRPEVESAEIKGGNFELDRDVEAIEKSWSGFLERAE
ncbi:hypothetical protein EG328_008264 [Venturia inaequalis]|uniref:Uncharacterized protein n=1 Tax=Venturia inaequalis TaxID=5025 RepID=A0A8H3UDA3_VENIN|nr:hypothetical protein EG328_008264 [Venturia inaequalis]